MIICPSKGVIFAKHMKKELLAIIRGIAKWRLFFVPKPFMVVTHNHAATIFVKHTLDNGPHMQKLHR